MREMKLRMQVLQAARRLSRERHTQSVAIGRRGVIIMWGNNVRGHCRKGEPQRK